MKKIFKRFISLMCAVACVMPLAAGCKKNNTANTDGKVVLRLWTKPSQDADEFTIKAHDKKMEALKKEFPDIVFEESIAPNGSDYRQEYDKALMAGTAPDIYTEFSYTDIPTRIQNGTVADITQYVEDWDLKKEGKVLDTFDNAISRDGKWYALPRQAYVMATLCNKKIISDAGIDVDKLPATWDEFADVGEKVTDFSVPRVGYTLMGMDWCAWPFTAWVWSAGGEMVEKNDDGTYKISFNEEPGVETAYFINQMIWKYKMTQKDVLSSLDDINNDIKSGKSCFSFTSLNSLKQSDLEEYGLNITDYIDMPMPTKDASIPRVALSGGEVITFNPKSTPEQLEAAVKVAKYLYFSDEMMQLDCDNIKEKGTINTNIPGRTDWYAKRLEACNGLSEEQIAALEELRKCAKAEPYCDHWADVKSQLVGPLQKIYLKEGITKEEIKKELDGCAEKIYSLYPETFKK